MIDDTCVKKGTSLHLLSMIYHKILLKVKLSCVYRSVLGFIELVVKCNRTLPPNVASLIDCNISAKKEVEQGTYFKHVRFIQITMIVNIE